MFYLWEEFILLATSSHSLSNTPLLRCWGWDSCQRGFLLKTSAISNSQSIFLLWIRVSTLPKHKLICVLRCAASSLACYQRRYLCGRSHSVLCIYFERSAVRTIFHPALCSRYELNARTPRLAGVRFHQLLQQLNIRLPHVISCLTVLLFFYAWSFSVCVFG
jgi:hypothetical protein